MTHASTMPIDADLAERLYHEAKAGRWGLPRMAFLHALETSAAKFFAGRLPGRRELTRYLSSLHLQDLALACACAEGHAQAWDDFVVEQRPGLYRAADALDPRGGAREIADSLYAELYGVDSRGEARQSLLRYFHGRSTLATWLRAVLSQRYIDRHRAARRSVALSDELAGARVAPADPDPECVHLAGLLRDAFEQAIGQLEPRDRLRLACYYAQELTLAETGRLLREHEATVSRQLARTRRVLRAEIERRLKSDAGLNDVQVRRCFECIIGDVGPLHLAEMLSAKGARSLQGPPARSFYTKREQK